ncbi:hypothetical protein ACFX2F_018076 [Malus domestica]
MAHMGPTPKLAQRQERREKLRGGERRRAVWETRGVQFMAESNDAVSLDMEKIYLGGKEHFIRTGCGSVSVIVYGDQEKPALITYPDLALNHVSCFQGLFFCPEAASLLLHNFCIYHISPPGHELGAASVCTEDPVPSVDDLADQILEVLNFFGLGAVMCMGVTAGAYIISLFAMKYRERVLGLILVSPLCKAPSWTEWFYNKVMSNMLYFYGMCGLLKECLLQRYFSKEVRGSVEVPESDIVQACRKCWIFKWFYLFDSLGKFLLQLLEERQSLNVWRFLHAINRRPDITEGLKSLRCRTLIFVGDSSPFHSEALHMTSKLDRRYSALVEVQACGSMVTEEQPHAMLIPMEYFFMGRRVAEEEASGGRGEEVGVDTEEEEYVDNLYPDNRKRTGENPARTAVGLRLQVKPIPYPTQEREREGAPAAAARVGNHRCRRSSVTVLVAPMELGLIGVEMSPAFRRLLLPICQNPSLRLHNKLSPVSRSLLLPVQLKPLSCAALDVIDSNPISGSCLEFAPNSETQLRQVRLDNGYSPDQEIVGSNVKTRPLVFDTKKRLMHYSGMLRTCVSLRSLNEGKAIHGQVIKEGIDPDSHLWVSLVNVYAKCGDSGYARRVLDVMPERDVVSWTSLIQGFVVEGSGVDAVKLFCEMKKDGTKANDFALATGLKACSLCSDLGFGKQLHAEAVKHGLLLDAFVGSALVGLYAKCGDMELADRVLFCMPEQDVVSWNALLNGYAQEGDGKKSLELFCRMTESEIRLSKSTLSTVLKGCANSGNLSGGQFLHSLVVKIGFQIDEFLGCSLVDMYSKCGMAVDAVKAFRTIENPDVVAWSAIISCLDQQGQWQEVPQLFREMISTGISPNKFTLSSIISAATDLRDLHFGESIHAFAWKYGCEADISVSNALITMYMKSGRLLDGAQVFEAMTNPDLISWNALLSGAHNHELSDLGPRVFHQMLVEGLKPNMYSFISVLRCCSSLLDVDLGKQIHSHIIKTNLDDNDFVGTALIDMYAKGRFVEDAVKAFNRLSNRDLFTWTVIITGYAQTDQAEESVACFNKMQQEGVKPNEFSIAGCLSACSRTAMLENGRQLHSMVIKSGHLEDLFVTSALVDMYAKCGCISDAEDIFEGLVSRDTVSWNIMVCGYSQYGQGEKALEAFSTMLDEGAIPNEITFIGVLSACSHLGLVEEGKKHFDSLSNVFGITPTIEHYACMVDILGRAGKFNEIETFIETKELTPYAIIWETVLGACKMHGNVEFGETAARRLFELKPEMDSTYILLSNIFAVKGRWDDVSKVRKLMQSQGVKKEPGCSWVEVDGQVNIFVSQDGTHPRIGDIHLKLEELGEKLNSLGYIPETEDVLHRITEREKKEHLQYHSERLALGFALISTSHPKTIRIFKNLRICGDCHDVMKLVSDVTNREIVVRDIRRFHHFKNGTCSCKDFW